MHRTQAAGGGSGLASRLGMGRRGLALVLMAAAMALLWFVARPPPSPPAPRVLPDPFPARFETDVSDSGPARFKRLWEEVGETWSA